MPRSLVAVLLGLLACPASLLTGCDRGDRVELVLEAKQTDAGDQAMEKAREVIERRIGDLGESGATVVRQGPNRILVALRRAEDAGPVKALVGRSARLQFRMVDTTATLAQLNAGQAPPGARILALAEGGGPVAVRGLPIVTDSMIVDARSGYDGAGHPSVNLRFNDDGTRRFARATRENVGRPLAIVVDDVVISAPNINEPILGGQAQISGNFTVESANELAAVLRSGALPVEFDVVGERVLKP
ncbi:MAG: preprotein translocase subunit SecD [Allosphingosinicella sp.]